MPEKDKAIGKRIKELRTQKLHMSQVDFADKINVSKQTLYKYENGIITNIPSNKIEAIAKLCDVSPAYLMGWEEKDLIPKELLPPEKIKAFRIQKNISKEEMSSKLNMAVDVYDSYENGKYPFSEAMISKIFDIFGEPIPGTIMENGHLHIQLVGSNIEARRKICHLSIEDLAAKTEIPVDIINAFENSTLFPSQQDLDLIAVALNTSADYLLGFPGYSLTDKRTTCLSVVSSVKPDEKQLLAHYRKLNDIGKKVAIERIQELAELPKYTAANHLLPIAAHNDAIQSKEEQALMQEDLNEL